MSNAFGRSRFVGNGALIMVAMLAALGCYTISLKVSAERAAVDKLRAQVVADAHDIRMLQSELRTRARLPELQRWNDQVLALSAPGPKQFLHNPVQLAAFAPGAPKPVTPPAAAVAPSTAPSTGPAPATVAPAPATAAPLLPVTPRSTNQLAPGLKTINYAVPARTRLAPAAGAAPAAPTAATTASAGLDASLVESVESAAAAPANAAAAKAPRE